MLRSNTAPIRVLHVIGKMNRGGIETWLMEVLRSTDRAHMQIDFLVHTDQPCIFDDEIRALGSRIIHCPYHQQPLAYARHFKHILRTYGPYDVVHSHVFRYSGFVMRLAAQAGVPIRIVHSHTAPVQARLNLARRLYMRLMDRQISRYATLGLAASRKAAAALFGPDWQQDARWQVLYCGIDLTPFGQAVDRADIRAQLNIAEDAFVIGHVGRFVEVKNHGFLVDIATELAQHLPNTHLLLIGDGPLRPAIEEKIAQLGLSARATVGPQPEISPLMVGAMDVFVLPSLYEGLPISGIEAQAAGLPIVLSDVVTDELDEVKPLLQRVSLTQPAAVWASSVLKARQLSPAINRPHVLSLLEQGRFNIHTTVRQLRTMYQA